MFYINTAPEEYPQVMRSTYSYVTKRCCSMSVQVI